MRKSRLKLSTVIILLVCLVVLVSLLITDLLITDYTGENIQDQLEEKTKIISRTVAESQVVQEGLQGEVDPDSIQEYAMTIQEKSNVLFIVVMDMNGIRMSHPVASRIGKHFVGGDEERVLQGEEYISTSMGTLGKSLRAFTPVYNENDKQIGAVAVGISLEAVQDSIQQSHKRVIFGSIFGMAVGIIGAFLLAKYIKSSLFGLEPYAIARIHEERDRMLHSVREGIIAIDKENKIVLVNKSARQIFQKAGLMHQEPVGMKSNDFLPGTMLNRVLVDGVTEMDEEQTINGVSIITNRVPLVVNDQVVGAIATFRDKTEVNKLAEQLTGVQMYADTLRAQSHEFMNQLHVLLGLIKMGNYDEVNHFISKLVNHQAHEVENITRYIKNPVLAGFLIGKMSAARESHVQLTLHCETEIPQFKDSENSHELITILGNLMDNAVESVRESRQKRIDVTLSYIDGLLTIQVSDTGEGIPQDRHEEIFQKGVSTKEGNHRGFGLYLTRQSVEKMEGSIDVSSGPEQGAVFTVIIPYEL
ncbi:DcuS/MalK family sensor histidine kinase [Indiicoccus explosivorum]|uniref:DcuS/MalK family sensor histidine kinase n=1 Tax=Indiicoccus explosivorum TaxID=1917864 RepID=UPI000B43D900|nr:DcuS/MalK family sensor histidine kinase [Indiicoccus explosivorum]